MWFDIKRLAARPEVKLYLNTPFLDDAKRAKRSAT
jgi:hypothetical protein